MLAGAMLPVHRLGFEPSSASDREHQARFSPASSSFALRKHGSTMFVAQLRVGAPLRHAATALLEDAVGGDRAGPCSHVTALTDVVVCSRRSASGDTVVLSAVSRSATFDQWSHWLHNPSGSATVTAVAADATRSQLYVALALRDAEAPSASFSLPADFPHRNVTVLVALFSDGTLAWSRVLHSQWEKSSGDVLSLLHVNDVLLTAGTSTGQVTFEGDTVSGDVGTDRGQVMLPTTATRGTVPRPSRCFIAVLSAATGTPHDTPGFMFGSSAPDAQCHVHALAQSGTNGAYVGGGASAPADAVDTSPPVLRDTMNRAAPHATVGFLGRVPNVTSLSVLSASAFVGMDWSTWFNQPGGGAGSPPLGAVRQVRLLPHDRDALVVLADGVSTSGAAACALLRVLDTAPRDGSVHRDVRLPEHWATVLQAVTDGPGTTSAAGLACDTVRVHDSVGAVFVPVTAAGAVTAVALSTSPGDVLPLLGATATAGADSNGRTSAALVALDPQTGSFVDGMPLAVSAASLRLGTKPLSLSADGTAAYVALSTAGVVTAPDYRTGARRRSAWPALLTQPQPHSAGTSLRGLLRISLPAFQPTAAAVVQAPRPLPPTQADLRPVLDPTSFTVTGYVLRMDVRPHSPAYRVTGGRFQRFDGSGAGFRFMFDPADVFAAPANQWTTLRADVAAEDALGLDDPLVRLDDWQALHSFVLERSGPVAGPQVDTSQFVDVRNAMLVQPSATCSTGCGQLPVVGPSLPLVLHPLPRTAAEDDAGAPVRFVAPLPVPSDAGRLVHLPCNCLQNVTVTLQLRLNGMCDVLAMELTSDSDFLAGAKVPLPRAVATTTVVLSEAHHFGDPLAVDWSDLALVSVQVAPGAAGPPCVSVSVERLELTRPCVRPDRVHADAVPTASQPRFPAPFSAMRRMPDHRQLAHGVRYRLIARGVNVYGDVSPPVCSVPFLVDLTPPDLSSVTALDVQPATGVNALAPAPGDVAFVGADHLEVSWVGAVQEPQSTTQLLEFFVQDVLFASNMSSAGVPVSPHRLLPSLVGLDPDAPAVARVATAPGSPPLKQGVQYVAVLGVRNGARLVASVATDGVVPDWTPPVAVMAPHVAEARTGAAPQAVTATATGSALEARWAFQDPHTTVAGHLVGLGTRPDGTDAVEFQPLSGAATTMSLVVPSRLRVDGQVFHVVVRTWNPANVTVTVPSAPFYFDSSPPVMDYIVAIAPGASHNASDPPSLTLGWHTLAAEDGAISQHSGSGVFKAKWRCIDDDSVGEQGSRGVMTYRWRVCRSAACDDPHDAVDVLWTDAGAATHGEASKPVDAADAQRLWLHLECTNPAGLTTAGVSAPLEVRPTPPTADVAFARDALASCVAGSPGSEVCVDVNYTSELAVAVQWGGFTVVDVDDPPITTYTATLYRNGSMYWRVTVPSR